MKDSSATISFRLLVNSASLALTDAISLSISFNDDVNRVVVTSYDDDDVDDDDDDDDDDDEDDEDEDDDMILIAIFTP